MASEEQGKVIYIVVSSYFHISKNMLSNNSIRIEILTAHFVFVLRINNVSEPCYHFDELHAGSLSSLLYKSEKRTT